MEAIRQTLKVKNHTINIILPEDFHAEFVDVIVLPSQNSEYSIPQWQIDEVRERTKEYFKNPAIALDFDDVSDSDFVLNNEQIKILEERSNKDNAAFISAEESISRLKKRQRV